MYIHCTTKVGIARSYYTPHDHNYSNNYFTFTVNLILLRLYNTRLNSNPGNRITQINVARPLNALTLAVNFNNTHFNRLPGAR